MKNRKTARPRADAPKIRKRRVYRDIEIAMEKRALAIRPLIHKETTRDEITDWTEAETETLEG